MEFFGLIAFILVLSYSAYPRKIQKLEREIKKLYGGNLEMSKIISGLVGKSCRITTVGDFATQMNATILEVDSDWTKIQKIDKRGIASIEIMRVDDIKKIDLIVE